MSSIYYGSSAINISVITTCFLVYLQESVNQVVSVTMGTLISSLLGYNNFGMPVSILVILQFSDYCQLLFGRDFLKNPICDVVSRIQDGAAAICVAGGIKPVDFSACFISVMKGKIFKMLVFILQPGKTSLVWQQGGG